MRSEATDFANRVKRFINAAAIAGGMLFGGLPSFAVEPPTSPADAEPRSTRSLERIDDDIDDALRALRGADETIDEGATLEALVRLHREAVRHEKYGRSPTLEKLEFKIRNRLRIYRDGLVHDLDLAPPPAALERPFAPNSGGFAVRPSDARLEIAADRKRQLADLQALSASIDVAFLQASLDGGPAGLIAQSLANSPGGSRDLVAFGGGTIRDYGAALVELITATISPDSWAVNGGHSTIYYYAPLHALVVSAPMEVHPHVGGLLGAMRAAGN